LRRQFEELDLHSKSLKALKRQGLHQLTEIQEKTFDVIVSGQDVVGRARTGTGKTLSFLLPALERVVRKHDKETLPPGISILVLSPTRELAAQIAKEAERLVAEHGQEISSQVIYGGFSRRDDIHRFESKLPTVLVATPGRLKDHIASTKLRGNKPFVDALQNLQVLILDETDRLLDMGFRRDVQDIVSCLPRKRQTLLFSATLPKDVREVVELATKPDYQLIDCIQDEDPATQTNVQTNQSYVTIPTEQFWTKTMEYLLDLADRGDDKIMVFFPMTSLVQLYAQLFNSRFGRRVLELHGKMQQRERTTISRRFRNSKKGILFTSDVSARGVDYPDVNQVIQIGACESRETYVHRLGRTGRAGKKGMGVLILPDLEKDFLRELQGLDITRDKDLTTQLASLPPSKKFMNELGPVVQKVRSGNDPKLHQAIHDAYQAMIPYYFQRSEDKQKAITAVNRLVDVMGLPELPAIDATRAKRLKLNNMPGLNIQSNWSDQNWQSGWGEGGASAAPLRLSKAHGDFGGKLKREHSSNDSGRQRSERRNKESQKEPSLNDTFYDNRKEQGRRERRAQQFNDAFSKVGPKKGDNMTGKPALAKVGKPTFQRWETRAEFASKA
jgi:ATP-dependent RNA helicase MSS116